MEHSEVPSAMSRRLAGAIAGVSPKTFRARFLKTGLIPIRPDLFKPEGTGDGWISLGDLEKALGREVSLREVKAAEERLDRVRERELWSKRARSV